jgi:hypothetical protein
MNYHPKGISEKVNRLNRPKDISVSLRRVIRLSQWFITLFLTVLYLPTTFKRLLKEVVLGWAYVLARGVRYFDCHRYKRISWIQCYQRHSHISKKHYKCKRNFEDIFNRTKDISNSPRWVIRLSLWFIRLCLWLYCITEAGNNHGTKWPKSLYILQMYYKKNRIWVISCNNKDIVPCAINISRKQILHRTNDAKKQLIQASENDIFI